MVSRGARLSRLASVRLSARKRSVRSMPSISPSQPSASARARRAMRSVSISSSRASIEQDLLARRERAIAENWLGEMTG